MAAYPTIPNTFVARTLIQSSKHNENSDYINDVFSSGDYRYNANEIYVNDSLFVSNTRAITASSAIFTGSLTSNSLTVTSTGAANMTLAADTNNSGQEDAVFTLSTDGGTAVGELAIQSNGAGLRITNGLANSIILGMNGAQAVQFFTTDIARQTILADGKVGIGTNAPTQLFEVAGISKGTQFMLTDGITAPAAVLGFAQIYVDTADGDLKVVFGDGFVRTIGADS